MRRTLLGVVEDRSQVEARLLGLQLLDQREQHRIARLHVGGADAVELAALPSRRGVAVGRNRIEVTGEHGERPAAARSTPHQRKARAEHFAASQAGEPLPDEFGDPGFGAGHARHVHERLEQVGQRRGDHGHGRNERI